MTRMNYHFVPADGDIGERVGTCQLPQCSRKKRHGPFFFPSLLYFFGNGDCSRALVIAVQCSAVLGHCAAVLIKYDSAMPAVAAGWRAARAASHEHHPPLFHSVLCFSQLNDDHQRGGSWTAVRVEHYIHTVVVRRSGLVEGVWFEECFFRWAVSRVQCMGWPLAGMGWQGPAGAGRGVQANERRWVAFACRPSGRLPTIERRGGTNLSGHATWGL